MLNFEPIEQASVATEPFPYFMAKGVLSPEALQKIKGDFPPISQPGVFPPPVAGQYQSEVTATSSGKNTVNIWQGRSCLNCHTQVHGSNNPASGVPLGNPTPQYLFR